MALRKVGGEGSLHFHKSKDRSENPLLRFSPPGLPTFSESEGYLRVESSAENLGSFLLPPLSFFGIPMKEVNFQPVARDMEWGLRGGTRGTSSGVGDSMGSRDGEGAVDGRLRMGRRSFGGVFTFSLSGDSLALRRVNVSFPEVPLSGIEGELKARPADRGRRGAISCGFPFSCIVDGRFLVVTNPRVGRESARFVAVDGRSTCFRLLLPLCVVVVVAVDDLWLVTVVWESPDVEGRMARIVLKDEVVLGTPELVAVDGRWLVAVVWESPDVEGRTTRIVLKDEPVLGTPELVAALCFLTSLAWAASLLTRFKARCSTSRHLFTNWSRSGSIWVPFGWFLAKTSFDLRTTADEITARCLGTSRRCGKSGMASRFNNGIFAPRNLRDSIAWDLCFLSESDPSGESGVGNLSGAEVETTKM